ncbi:hypothetical protein [Williamsia deligens]|uniref:Uncharacterized protein n=1 Tax=Williamsia deligens TaxID=321325 RepID=A0ABW3G6K0_9NOCA|nr:hypothetical protein [Williamsia deligens]MCP2193516.1 hypothetical protein [Williamsia deligens]
MTDNHPRRRDAAAVEVTSDTVQRWCERATIPGRHPELSDAAAVAIATGHLDSSARAVVLARMRAGLPIPSSWNLTGTQGFAELRRLQRTVAALDEQADAPLTPAMVAALIRARRNSVARKLDDARRALVGGKGIFATGVRAIRRERREGTHLEAVDRERLFLGLTHTPTPDLGSYVRRMGNAALERVAGAIENAAAKAGKESGRRWITDLLGDVETATPGADSKFVDGYETMLFAVGSFYDRVQRCPAWHSEHFAVQRGQVDLEAELADVAADVVALRTIRVDLESSRRAAGGDAELLGHIAQREESLRPVWRELVDRVAALATVAEVVESAATELRVLEEFAHTTTIDDRIDQLVSRSGNREISADNTRRLTEQVRSGEENIRIYRDVLQGNILRLASGGRPWSGK